MHYRVQVSRHGVQARFRVQQCGVRSAERGVSEKLTLAPSSGSSPANTTSGIRSPARRPDVHACRRIRIMAPSDVPAGDTMSIRHLLAALLACTPCVASAGTELAFADFEQLVRETYADTYTLAYRLCGNEEDAADVTQETYLRAWKGLKRFRGDAQLSTWLYRITANCASSHLSRRTKHRHEELDDDTPVADDRREADPEMRAEDQALRRRLQGALEELPPDVLDRLQERARDLVRRFGDVVPQSATVGSLPGAVRGKVIRT